MHQIFPNASDQISLALFCTFRAGGWDASLRRFNLPLSAEQLRKYQLDQITPVDDDDDDDDGDDGDDGGDDDDDDDDDDAPSLCRAIPA